MTKRRLQLASITLAAACAVAALADPQSGRRGDRGQGGGNGGVERMDRGGGGGPGGGWQGPGDWNSEQAKQFREQLEKFCEKHAPNRWNDLKNTFGEARRNPRVGSMAMRFAGLKQLQKEDQKLYDIKVRLIELEDDEYGLLKQLKAPDNANDAEKLKTLQGQLQAKSQEYVAQRLLERSHRIAKLNELIQSEQAKLDSDKKNQDKLTGDRVQQMMAEGLDFFTPKPQPFRRGDGEGPPGPTTIHAAPAEPKQ
jgi:hypothetical protein